MSYHAAEGYCRSCVRCQCSHLSYLCSAPADSLEYVWDMFGVCWALPRTCPTEPVHTPQTPLLESRTSCRQLVRLVYVKVLPSIRIRSWSIRIVFCCHGRWWSMSHGESLKQNCIKLWLQHATAAMWCRPYTPHTLRSTGTAESLLVRDTQRFTTGCSELVHVGTLSAFLQL